MLDAETLEERVARLEALLADTTDEDLTETLAPQGWQWVSGGLPSVSSNLVQIDIRRLGDRPEFALRVNGAYTVWRHQVVLKP